jgi:hypothetical protein
MSGKLVFERGSSPKLHFPQSAGKEMGFSSRYQTNFFRSIPFSPPSHDLSALNRNNSSRKNQPNFWIEVQTNHSCQKIPFKFMEDLSSPQELVLKSAASGNAAQAHWGVFDSLSITLVVEFPGRSPLVFSVDLGIPLPDPSFVDSMLDSSFVEFSSKPRSAQLRVLRGPKVTHLEPATVVADLSDVTVAFPASEVHHHM